MPIIFNIDPGGLRGEIDQVFDELATEVIQFALAFYQAVTSGTPVDTGYARSNWLVDFGSFVARTVGTRPASGSGPIPAPSGQQLQTWTVDKGSIFIHNSVDYIEFLEQGSSAQAPQGILLPALAAAEARFG